MTSLPRRSLACLLLSLSASLAGEFRVGAARVEITPKDGTPLGGFYKFRGSAGVLDPLFAKTLVLEQDGSQAAIVMLDLSGTVRPIVAAARQLIEQQCGIPGGQVLIAATHTHSGPQQPRGSLMDDITQVNSPAGTSYAGSLPGWIAESVRQAQARLAPVTAAVAIGAAPGISFNRRVLREGRQEAIWQPQQLTPQDRPAGPVDPEVGVLVFSAAGRPVASLLNFAMHPTSVGGGVKISADYPGVFTRLVSERHGADLIALFANGAGGNINHTDYRTGQRRSTLALGTALADAVTAVWPRLQPTFAWPPRTRSEQVTLPRRTFTAAQIAKAKEQAAHLLTGSQGTVAMAETVCILETLAKQDQPLLAEVQVIAISDEVAIVGLPGEVFVELGLSLKQASPFKHTFIAELANGSIGYIPNQVAYPQGNYEIVSARCAAGSGEQLIATAVRLLHAAKPGP